MTPSGASRGPDTETKPLWGLTTEEVRERTVTGQTNEVPDTTSRSVWQILRANVFTLFNALVAGGFILLLLLGQWRDALFGFAAVGNAIIGVVQEYRAKRLLDRLAVLEAPHARVRRDGNVQEIASAAVVRDDVLLLRAGDQVSADAIILDCEGLEIDESLLTGESDPVAKPVGTEALSGSAVVAGQGMARVIRVGTGSFASNLTAEAKRFSLVHSEIRNGINRVLRWISWALIPAGAIVINGQMQAQGGWEHAVETGEWANATVGAVGGIIAMIPLGLVLLTSVAFAVGGLRLAREKVLVQELAAVEGLARVDVLCLDKTGTVTEGGITFKDVHELGTACPPGWRHAPWVVRGRPRRQRHSPKPCLGIPGRTRSRPGIRRPFLLSTEVERRRVQRRTPCRRNLVPRRPGTCPDPGQHGGQTGIGRIPRSFFGRTANTPPGPYP